MSAATGSRQVSYTYDGSFHGLMTVAHEASKRNITPHDIIAGEPESPLLFHDYVHIATDPNKAEAVIRAIKTRLPSLAYKRVLFCYLSEAAHAATCVIDYLTLGWRCGALLDHYTTHEKVKPLHVLSEKVAREWHRMMGLVRFKLTAQGILYAAIEPDHNVLPLLSLHFAERMAGENWIIHDVGRNTASRYSGGEWDIFDFEVVDAIAYGDGELAYQELWNNYFTNIAIGYRKNKGLQKQFLPRRYWKHLVECISD
ncbi:MAG: DNA metabolism protein [Spirochaetes bacterium]|nr:MAG: DNA metabolism protein [Spirochaetota bacterium]